MIHNISEPTHYAFTVLSLGALFGWIIGALGPLSLIVTLTWGVFKTVDTWYAIKLKRLEYRARK